MSDFTSDFWHLFVAGATLVSIIACLILLWISGTTKAATHEGPDFTVSARNSDCRVAWIGIVNACVRTSVTVPSASMPPVVALYRPACNVGRPAWGPRYTHRSWCRSS